MRKETVLLFLSIFVSCLAYGQKMEYSLHLNSGLFSFKGANAAHTSVLNRGGSAQDGYFYYTNDIYGGHSQLAWGGAAQVQRVTKSNLILGAQLGFEHLSSKVNIHRAQLGGESIVLGEFADAEGETIYHLNFVNLNPYLGKRFQLAQLALDLTVGADLAYGLGGREKGQATVNSSWQAQHFTSNYERPTPELDFRVRAGLAAYYKNLGIHVGYSAGLTNYKSDMISLNHQEVYARYIRMGLSWRFAY